MFELHFFFPSKNIRYVWSFGHGSKYHGQIYFFSIIKEEIEKNEVVFAEMLFSI